MTMDPAKLRERLRGIVRPPGRGAPQLSVPAESGILQMHSSTYRNPKQLPAGAILVVGAGSSGVADANHARSAIDERQ